MFYTDNMRRAVHSLQPPVGFGVDIAEHSDNGTMLFLEVIIDENKLARLSHDDKIAAVIYTMKVRDILEKEGAVVQVTRNSIGNSK